MAWRIHDNVIRGEIDNRVKGLVRGKLWLDGQALPMRSSFTGSSRNCLKSREGILKLMDEFRRRK